MPWHHRRLGGPIRTVYAAQFQLEPPGGDAAALEATVGRLAAEWVSAFYPAAVALPPAGAEVAPHPGHSLHLALASDGAAYRHFCLTWRRPSPTHAIGWEAILTLATSGALAELSCVVRLGPARKPSHAALRRPSIVRAVVEELPCFAGGLPLRAHAAPLAAELVPVFVEGGLCSPERVLPVLVISRAELDDQPAVEPEVLVDRLVGLAHVVVLDDQRAAAALAEAVGTARACADGALRLYQPGFSLRAKPAAHELYVPPRVRARGRPLALPDVILQRLAADASAQFQPGAITGAAREALGLPDPLAPAPATQRPRGRPQRAAALEAPAPATADAQPDHAALEWLVAENEGLATRNAELEQQLLAREVELEEAQDTIAAQRAQLDALGLALRSRPSGARTTTLAEEPELTSVADAVAVAKVRFAERLLFLPSADDSAAASPFQNARRAFEALAAVDEVAGLRRASITERRPVGSMENLFQARGFLYKGHESMTARGRWGEEYQVVFQGRKESIEEHVAIGTGGPESCLRIHFFWDDGSLRFVVAHVGRHKTNTKS